MTQYLVFEGGATRTVAGLYGVEGGLLAEAQAGPCNPVVYGMEASVAEVAALGRSLLAQRPGPTAAAAAVAGLAENAQQRAFGRQLGQALGLTRIVVMTDLHPVLYANAGTAPALLAIAGTGSAVLGQDGAGHQLRVGGRGSLFGDEGSAYQVAVTALRAAASAVDGLGPQTALVAALPAVLGLEGFEALKSWAGTATKQAVADLTKTVSRLAEAGEMVAVGCIEEQACRLAEQVLAAQRRLALAPHATLLVHGGLFEHCRLFREAFRQALHAHTKLIPRVPACRGHEAVWALARLEKVPEWAALVTGVGSRPQPALPATEQRARTDRTLDQMTARQIVDYMNREDAGVAGAVARQSHAIAAAIEAAAQAIGSGGRIFYVGAGTSGRLGVLDASECPPTFGVAPERVVGIIAGGERALRRSVEGEEDKREQAAADLQAQGVRAGDLVIGITASATTPYVLAALAFARAGGIQTILLCCNPAGSGCADIVIALDTGPEVLAGSTRLKAGTATKMVLNMISTGAMALSGYVYDGLMVGLRPANAKLRQRAARIVSAAGGVPEEEGAALLQEAGDRTAVAVLMAARGLSQAAAVAALEAAGGVLRAALRTGR